MKEDLCFSCRYTCGWRRAPPGVIRAHERHRGDERRGIGEALAALRRARRPVAVLGLSASRSGVGRRIRQFLERYRLPFVTTMAATLARPGRDVAGVVGDGGFLMQAGEMATAARLGTRALFVMLRDESLSLIHAKQRRRGYRITGVDPPVRDSVPPPHYFGVPCIPARSAREFRAALTRVRRRRGSVVIEAIVGGSKYAELLYD